MVDASRIERITSELRVVTTALGQAGTNAAAADARSRDIASQAVGLGATGIAASLARLGEEIRQIQGRVVAIGVSVDRCVVAVATVPRGDAPEPTIAALAPIGEELRGAVAAIAAAVSAVEEAKRLAAVVLRGGTPGPMIAILDQVSRQLSMAAGYTDAANREVGLAVAEARQLGAVGN